MQHADQANQSQVPDGIASNEGTPAPAFQTAMEREFARWTAEEGLSQDHSAMELLSGAVELDQSQRDWLNAWVTLYPGPV